MNNSPVWKTTWMVLFFLSPLAGWAGSFDLDPSQEYRAINQFAGKPLQQYLNNHPNFGSYWNADGPVKITVATIVSGGTTYYKFKSNYQHWMGAPISSGGTLQIDSSGGNSPSYIYQWELIPYATPEGNHYGMCYVKNRSTGEYLCDGVNTNTELNLRGPDRTLSWPTTAALLPDDRRFIWKFSPSEYEPQETLAVPQGGWTPMARKTAVLCTGTFLTTPPTFQVTTNGSSTVLFSGSSIYWGQFWNDQYYYVLNLNDDILSIPGDYAVSCNGKNTQVHIRNDALIRPFRQDGSDRFEMEEIFDDNFGFCGHWGRLDNWWPQTYDYLDAKVSYFPHWMWRDAGDSNGNGVENEPITSIPDVTRAEGDQCLTGGWDVTDQWAHNYARDGMVLMQLAEMYHQVTNIAVRAELVEEILYGVAGALYRQEADGSWRQGFVDKIHWTGTTASLAAGFATVYPVLAAESPSSTNAVRNAMDSAWSYVSEKKDDITTWAVRGEGVLPDGTTLNRTLGGQRNLWREAYLMQAIYMYLATGEAIYFNAAETEISAGTLSSIGGWIKTSGSFAGQRDGQGGCQVVASLLDFYPYASGANRSRIEDMAQTYYDSTIVEASLLDGAFGNYEGRRRNYASADIWDLYKRVYAAAHIYDVLGEKYGEGMLLAQRTIDWYMGANPYSSSLLSGVGNRHIVDGWSSYHTAGRHTGFMAGTDGGVPRLMGSDSGYGGTESAVSGSLVLWNAMVLLDKHQSGLDGVTLFSGANFAGEKACLPAGEYNSHQLVAYGLDLDSISSLQVPEDYLATLYDDANYSGVSALYYSNEPTLGAMDNQTESIVIAYAPPTPPVQAVSPTPASGALGERTSVDLEWENGGNASFFKVYLNGILRVNDLRSTFFDPGLLAYDTTYTWRIDSANSLGVETGATWSFTTRTRTEAEQKISDFATAEQSTGLWGDAYPAANGLDGNLGNFTHTDETTMNNYWQMNLDKDYEVSQIDVWNRPSSSTANRLNNAYVMLLDDSLSCVWSNQIIGATSGLHLVYHLPPGRFGRHVRVGLVNGEANADGNFIVSVAEAEVYSLLHVDIDGDGLDDDWEEQYAFDPLVPDNTSVDSDGDGATLAEEFIAGTDPANASDRFQVQFDSSLSARFPTSLARLYSLQWSTNIVDIIWNPLPGQTDLIGTGEDMTLPVPTEKPFSYYRIKVSTP